MMAAERTVYGRDFGRVRVEAPPPAFVWHHRGEGILLPTAAGEPPVGRAYYTPEPSIPAASRASVDSVEAALAVLAGCPRAVNTVVSFAAG
jgi:hypothetical protein